MANISINARKNRSGDSPIDSKQREKIQKARNDAFGIVKMGLKDLDNIWKQSSRKRTKVRRRRDIRKKRKNAWIANKKVVKWFGRNDLTTWQIKRTRERLICIKKEFERTLRFTIIQHQTGFLSWRCCGNILAFCSPGTPIKLCPDWFKGTSEKAEKERAITVVHELSHKNGHIHRRGFEDVKDVTDFAINHPRLARRNPYNFEQFCGAYYSLI